MAARTVTASPTGGRKVRGPKKRTDTTPDAFEFTAVTGAEPGATYTSNTVTLAGFTGTVNGTISGGTASKNGGAFSSDAFTAVATDTLAVRGVAGAASATVDVVATVGGTIGLYQITSYTPGDTTPEAITFSSVTGAAVSTLTASENVTPTGFGEATTLTVDAGVEYSTDNGSTWASVDALFSPGTTLKIRFTSSANPSTATTKGGSLGGVDFTFTVTTAAGAAPEGTLVSTLAALHAAIDAAADGDVIRVAAGNYAYASITGKTFGTDITIKANDSGNKPVFAGMKLSACTHIKLQDLVILPGGSPLYGLHLVDCTDITMSGCVARKTEDLGTYLGAHGAFVRRCTRTTIDGCEFKWTQYGIAHLDCDFLTITDNDFHDIGTDGIQGGGSNDVTIARNRFRDFYTPDTHHPDAIQFWTTNVTRLTERVTIEDNLIYRGAGDPMQGIFFGDKYGLSWAEITVQRNAVVGAMYHGIRLSALSTGPKAQGIVYRDNFVLGFSDQRSWISAANVVDLTMGDNQYSYLNNGVITTLTDEGGNVKLTEATSVGDYTLLDAWLGDHTDVPARA